MNADSILEIILYATGALCLAEACRQGWERLRAKRRAARVERICRARLELATRIAERKRRHQAHVHLLGKLEDLTNAEMREMAR